MSAGGNLPGWFQRVSHDLFYTGRVTVARKERRNDRCHPVATMVLWSVVYRFCKSGTTVASIIFVIPGDCMFVKVWMPSVRCLDFIFAIYSVSSLHMWIEVSNALLMAIPRVWYGRVKSTERAAFFQLWKERKVMSPARFTKYRRGRTRMTMILCSALRDHSSRKWETGGWECLRLRLARIKEASINQSSKQAWSMLANK